MEDTNFSLNSMFLFSFLGIIAMTNLLFAIDLNLTIMKIDAVIKIGGSLVSSPSFLSLCGFIKKISKKYNCIIVPGGGGSDDLVREFDKKFHLSDKTSHRMAILAMDQYGLLLSNLMDGYTIEELKIPKTFPKKPVIFLSSKYMFEKDPLENSWQVTSDSIAAHVAQKLNARKLILVKDVDGIYSSDPQKNPRAKLIKSISARKLLSWKETCVDKFLPKILLKNKLKCYIVNGKHPERIEKILKEKMTTCTQIF